MATFNSLPTEIKALIIFSTSLPDIGNFFSTNKSFALLSKREDYAQFLQKRVKEQRKSCNISGYRDQNGIFRLRINTTRARGRLPESFQKSELLHYCWKLYLPLPHGDIVPNLTRDELIRSIQYQLWNDDASNFSTYKLKYYYSWLHVTRSQICDLLQKYLV